MESTNIHPHHRHHIHEPQLVVVSSSLPISSSYGLNAWTATSNSNLNSNAGYINPYSNEIQSQQHQHPAPSLVSSQYNLSMPPDLNQFNTWVNNTNNQSPQDLHQLSSMKEELAAQRYYTKYTDILSSSPTSTTTTTTTDELSLRPKFVHKSSAFSSQPPHFYSSATHHDVFGAAPSVNHLSAGSNNFNMDLHALDLLTSSRFGATLAQNSPNQTGFIRDAFSYGFHDMDQSQQLQSYSSPKISSSSSASNNNNNNGGVGESKRNSSKMEQAAKKQAIQTTSATKKSRVDARASCPPFKVRKEKLGDRIAALQQLVAPFGKTDTASVLMEAIGYIKFLQSQVETLSVPYMKSSRNNASRVIKGVANENANYEESQRDLKSRGLCLVPLSCLSYISDGGGTAVWPPPHFGGATI